MPCRKNEHGACSSLRLDRRTIFDCHCPTVVKMRRTFSFIAICLVLLFTTFVHANPIAEASSLNPTLRFAKRSACSNGIKTNCGSASVACSGSQCTVCCGSCCQCFTCELSDSPEHVFEALILAAPRDNSCGSSTPVVNPDCSGKCGSGSSSSFLGSGSGSSSTSTGNSKQSGKSLLCRLFHFGC